jgi:hypothetical protein
MFRLLGEGVVNMTNVPEVRQDIWASGPRCSQLDAVQKQGKMFRLRGEGVVNMTTVPEVRQDMWDPGRGCGLLEVDTVPEARRRRCDLLDNITDV